MNEGLNVFNRLTLQQREARLQRCGLKAAMTPSGLAQLEQRGISPAEVNAIHRYYSKEIRRVHRQQYIVRIFNLQVVDILALGTGQAMRQKANAHRFGSLASIIAGEQRHTGGRVGGNDAGRIVEEDQPGSRAGIGRRDTGREGHLAEGSSAEVQATVQSPYNAGQHSRRSSAGQLCETAVRALYGLGLDSGEVRLTALGGKQFAAQAIIPLSIADSGVYQAASQALDAALALEQPGRPGLLMGMDPEFLLLRVSTGRVVPASRYLPLDGVAGCDAGPPGTQGAFPVAELRPQPRGEPRALLAQLMSAVRAADRLITDRTLSLRAGGMPLPGWALGGHLHFSGVTLTAPLLRALDNYLALPLMLLEDARAAARRPRYGVLGDFRIQPHGGFEYRTLPSFLVSPVIAKGAVFLAHLIVSRYEDLTLRPLDREDLHAAYYSGDKTPLRAAFIPLQAQLRGLPGYAQAAAYIEPLLGYIAQERTWDESRDIRSLWQSKAGAGIKSG
ncbi:MULTISPECIES: hypothetical protein [unclassified Paenibacillus]|uniref:putative amidoligase domain-containing protein n=1 Tax=unclassified Paenibacillus TaxID=185978 RepID=UPI002406CD2C|nr:MULTISPECIES: hypothetical protein [unclassified Paenibacillus]MDF9841036.1 hypothetical protein [Paenibacillus sp. PastF-2]MDF9847791.1 hypothetical protein [Paenibacillus sp. PastM-2]MDF9854360.1 hypothetical protein [Paenibacillus sp. PastF-1]MDH6479469.1 hypothetical protein [Paenibacillus sp. PastH-2]MDH6505135.1 hypothetical protein [Paenibacillus sp. PastM-3]